MAYPNFGKVKTIVIPTINKDGLLTIEDYKRDFGIDLRDIFYLDSDGFIRLKHENCFYLIDWKGASMIWDSQRTINGLEPAKYTATTAYTAGSGDASSYFENSGGTLTFLIQLPRTAERDIANISISVNEL